MPTNKNIFDFNNDTTDPIDRAKEALSAVRQYQEDWQDMGRDRVYKYFGVGKESEGSRSSSSRGKA